MESYLEPTKIAPEPTPIEKYLYSPIVPEISMISNTKTSIDNFSSQENVWKMKQREMQDHLRNQNFIPLGYKNLQTQFSKKQVRFESPVQQQTACLSQQLLHSKSVESGHNETNLNYHNFCAVRKQNMSKNTCNGSQPFEEIYMANIPDRKLDLSLIDLPKMTSNMQLINTKDNKEDTPLFNDKHDEIEETEISKNSGKKDDSRDTLQVKSIENKENEIPKTYQDFLELQKKITSKRKLYNDSVTDIFNYKRNNTNNQQITSPEQFNPHQQKSTLNESEKLDVQKQYKNIFDTHYQKHFEVYQQKVYPHVSNFESPVEDYGKPYLNNNNHLKTQKCDIETQTSAEDLLESKALENINICEPSNANLLKIIAQQNEQLLLLQRQVAMLLERDRSYSKPLEAPIEQDRTNSDSKKYATVSTPQKNHFRQENTITKQASIFQDNQRKWGMSKFSINLTTSFDMPLRAQQKQNFANNEANIQEITESDFSPKSPLDQSIHFQEPLNVREQCPSPQPSININMNDYESSDDETPRSEIGATFYNNLMGQVNNILKKAQIETEDFRQKGGTENDIKRNKTLNKVREATLKHLKSIGINVDEGLEPSDKIKNSPSEISLTVKQLLMKYLPPDHLKQQEKVNPISNEAVAGVLKVRPEFSMASLEYLKKYNLISSKEHFPQIKEPQKIGPKYHMDQNKRILDLTALKMQPKLL